MIAVYGRDVTLAVTLSPQVVIFLREHTGTAAHWGKHRAGVGVHGFGGWVEGDWRRGVRRRELPCVNLLFVDLG